MSNLTGQDTVQEPSLPFRILAQADRRRYTNGAVKACCRSAPDGAFHRRPGRVRLGAGSVTLLEVACREQLGVTRYRGSVPVHGRQGRASACIR